jgi:hypothetical protein
MRALWKIQEKKAKILEKTNMKPKRFRVNKFEFEISYRKRK